MLHDSHAVLSDSSLIILIKGHGRTRLFAYYSKLSTSVDQLDPTDFGITPVLQTVARPIGLAQENIDLNVYRYHSVLQHTVIIGRICELVLHIALRVVER